MRPAPRTPAPAAEGLGTLLLLAVVIGSGIMAERLAGGNAAIALLANTAATVGGLFVLIEVLRPRQRRALQSGRVARHGASGESSSRACSPAYVLAQLTGARAGRVARARDVRPALLQFSAKVRSRDRGNGSPRRRDLRAGARHPAVARGQVAALVACYIGAAYWFTASTSFANPAAAVGRMFSNSFAGIAPANVPGLRDRRAGRRRPGGARAQGASLAGRGERVGAPAIRPAVGNDIRAFRADTVSVARRGIRARRRRC